MAAASGFETVHRYPARVDKEAITNAVIHRDYHINRDIHVRIFDNRIEVESPGLFPGDIRPETISKAGSLSRNSLIVANLREFPTPPNIDAGEGVRMMFSTRESDLATARIHWRGRHRERQRLAASPGDSRNVEAGNRNFNLSTITRNDLMSLSGECEKVTGIPYVMRAYRKEAEKILTGAGAHSAPSLRHDRVRKERPASASQGASLLCRLPGLFSGSRPGRTLTSARGNVTIPPTDSSSR